MPDNSIAQLVCVDYVGTMLIRFDKGRWYKVNKAKNMFEAEKILLGCLGCDDALEALNIKE